MTKGSGAGLQDLTGTTVGRFHVRARLGAGGMGEVYRAEDTKLKRPVALKRVVPKLSGDPGYRQRFLKEAERASALTNQHIAAVYDVLEQNGEMFLVMEYVEGQTLRERIKQPIGLSDFFRIALQCGEALAAAHQKGLTHRDIKPENIMLTASGEVKVLDFGVARRLPQATSSESTATSGSSATGLSGTPAYMAPEVLLEKEADERADLFSLGVVLYEALGGRHPFRADSFMATCDRILREAPTPLHAVNPEVPPQVEETVHKLLAKDPAQRYSTAAEWIAAVQRVQQDLHPGAARIVARRPRTALVASVVAIALLAGALAIPGVRHRVRALLGIAAVPQAKHLVVLPFTAVGAEEKDRAFAEGLTETLTTKLTQLTERRTLQVVPAREARNSGVTSVEQARAEFGVNLVLEGSLQHSREAVRVTYALVDARTRRQVRAGEFTASAADPFAVADRVVEGVLHLLEVEVSPAEQQQLTRRSTQVAGAYDFYLQGRGYLRNYDRPENIESAISVFQRALELDAQFALAHSGLGEAFLKKYEATNDPRWIPAARQACERAASLNPDLGEAHMCLGQLLNSTGEYERGAAEWLRALEIEPTSDDAFRGLAFAQEQLRKFTEAERTYQRAIAQRAHYWAGYTWLGAFYHRQGRDAEAIQQFEQAVALAPDSVLAYRGLGGLYLLQGDYARAEAALRKAIELRPTAGAYSNLGQVYFSQRRFAEAVPMFEKAFEMNPSDFLTCGNLARAYYWMPGMRLQGLTHFEKAIALAQERLRVNPKDADVHILLASYYAMTRQRKPAYTHLMRAFELRNNDPEFLFWAAVVYNQFGEERGAISWLESAVRAGYSRTQIRATAEFENLSGDPRYQAIVQGR